MQHIESIEQFFSNVRHKHVHSEITLVKIKILGNEWRKFDRKEEMKQSAKWCDDDGDESGNSVALVKSTT